MEAVILFCADLLADHFDNSKKDMSEQQEIASDPQIANLRIIACRKPWLLLLNDAF